MVGLLLIALSFAAAFAYWRGGLGDGFRTNPDPGGGERPGDEDPASLPLLDSPSDEASSRTGAARVVAGWLEIRDPHDHLLERVPVAPSREGWFALPRRSALGAARLVFRPGQPGEAEAIEGIGRRGESVALWRIESPELAAAPPLMPWQERPSGGDAPPELLHFSYAGGGGEPVEPPLRLRTDGLFLHALDPVPLPGRGGALVQGGALVGWAIAEGPAEASEAELWLWNGPDGEDLDAERTVAELYRSSFAGGREEALAAAHALAEERVPAARSLAAFGAALRLRPRLAESDSRDRWLPSGAVGPVARALRETIDEGAPAVALGAIDESALSLLADGAVLLLVSDAVAAVEGPAAAIALLDRYGAWIPAGDPLEESLIARLRRHYSAAVAEARDAGDPGSAWALLDAGRRRFPDDAALQLTEAELWLDEGDWRNAATLISGFTFPAALRDRAAILDRRIAELRGLEGKIVIRFRPGAPSITTHAELSGIRQLFIIDTGASFTSIPWSMANALGFRIDANTPRRELRTASDIVVAPVVTLPTITLGGWTVENVEATVLDLPGHEEVGLLGLNFLGAFRVDLDRTQGILTLEPK